MGFPQSSKKHATCIRSTLWVPSLSLSASPATTAEGPKRAKVDEKFDAFIERAHHVWRHASEEGQKETIIYAEVEISRDWINPIGISSSSSSSMLGACLARMRYAFLIPPGGGVYIFPSHDWGRPGQRG